MSIESCDNCGACCREQVFPPGYQAIMCQGSAGWPDVEDIERFIRLPQDARNAIELKLVKLRQKLPYDDACCWLGDDGRCRFYEWRPNICREFERGGDSCISWRRKYEIGSLL